MFVGQGRLGKGHPGFADSWRNVVVNWVRKFERSHSEDQQDVAFQTSYLQIKLPSFTSETYFGF